MGERRGRGEIAPLMDFLVRYAVKHFEMEEALMVERGYPGYPAHRAHHEKFVVELTAMRAECETTGPIPTLVIRLSSWVTRWLREHIYRVDKQMADFIRLSEVPRPAATELEIGE
jgi:hemerythrin